MFAMAACSAMVLAIQMFVTKQAVNKEATVGANQSFLASGLEHLAQVARLASTGPSSRTMASAGVATRVTHLIGGQRNASCLADRLEHLAQVASSASNGPSSRKMTSAVVATMASGLIRGQRSARQSLFLASKHLAQGARCASNSPGSRPITSARLVIVATRLIVRQRDARSGGTKESLRAG